MSQRDAWDQISFSRFDKFCVDISLFPRIESFIQSHENEQTPGMVLFTHSV
jgi:hypothetical protein